MPMLFALCWVSETTSFDSEFTNETDLRNNYSVQGGFFLFCLANTPSI